MIGIDKIVVGGHSTLKAKMSKRLRIMLYRIGDNYIHNEDLFIC